MVSVSNTSLSSVSVGLYVGFRNLKMNGTILWAVFCVVPVPEKGLSLSPTPVSCLVIMTFVL